MSLSVRSEGNPRLRLAQELMAEEGASPGDASTSISACASVLAKLYRSLLPLVGNGGYETVLVRAVVLATRLHPPLGDISIPRSGPPSAEALAEELVDQDGTLVCEGAEHLVSEFLGFLGRLVGWSLSLVILRETWPEVVARFDSTELEATSPTPPSQNQD